MVYTLSIFQNVEKDEVQAIIESASVSRLKLPVLDPLWIDHYVDNLQYFQCI